MASDPPKEAFLDMFSPETQNFLKKAAAVGVTGYLGYSIYKSNEFQDLITFARNWGAEKDLNKYISWFVKHDPDHVPLFDLDKEQRLKIWEHVPNEDLKALRLVCKQLRQDIDYGVGVHVIADCRDTHSYYWLQNIILQGITIIRMESPRNWSFIGTPDFLKALNMSEECYITPPEFGDIFTAFPNLKSLSVYVHDDCFETVGRNQEIFSFLANKEEELYYLRIQYIADSQLCKWEMKFETPNSVQIIKLIVSNETYLPSRLLTFILNFEHYEGINSVGFARTRLFWKRFLETQTRLNELCCNYGPVCWDILTQVIDENVRKLRRIELHSVCHWDFWSAAIHSEVCFDWNFFRRAPNLDRLVLSAQSGPRPGPILYKPLEPCNMHLNILFCDLGECFWKTYETIIWANVKTLKQATLLRVSSLDQHSGEAWPFDWSIFSDCQTLSRVVVGGQYEKFLEHTNLHLLPTQELEDFKLIFGAFRRHDLIYIGSCMPKMDAGFEFLDNCIFSDLEEDESPLGLIWACRERLPQECNQEDLQMEEMIMEYSGYLIAICGTIWLLLV